MSRFEKATEKYIPVFDMENFMLSVGSQLKIDKEKVTSCIRNPPGITEHRRSPDSGSPLAWKTDVHVRST